MTGKPRQVLRSKFSVLSYGYFFNFRLKKHFKNTKRRTQNLRLRQDGFTFIELLIVLAVMALLSSLVVSVSLGKIRQSRESALKEDLHQLRKAIDDFYADSGKYPKSLAELVDHRYLRAVPVDPLTDSAETWKLEMSKDITQKERIVDVHSGSEEKSSDGGHYSDW